MSTRPVKTYNPLLMLLLLHKDRFDEFLERYELLNEEEKENLKIAFLDIDRSVDKIYFNVLNCVEVLSKREPIVRG